MIVSYGICYKNCSASVIFYALAFSLQTSQLNGQKELLNIIERRIDVLFVIETDKLEYERVIMSIYGDMTRRRVFFSVDGIMCQDACNHCFTYYYLLKVKWCHFPDDKRQ